MDESGFAQSCVCSESPFSDLTTLDVRRNQNGICEQFLVGFIGDSLIELWRKFSGRTGQGRLGKGEHGGNENIKFHGNSITQGGIAFYSFVVSRRIGQ